MTSHRVTDLFLKSYEFIMSERKLRSGTRKDYTKMVDSVDAALEESSDGNKSDDQYACVDTAGRDRHLEIQNKQKQQHEHGDGDGDSSDEHSNHNDNVDLDLQSSSSESDEDLRDAEVRLEILKQEQKLLYKQSKRARIAKETEAVEKSLSKLKREGKHAASKKSKSVTVKSLRSMDDIVEQVDRLMDSNMKIKSIDSSEGESDCVSSSGRLGRNSSHQSRARNAVKGNQQEKKSGKSKNCLTSDYKFPQMWPHSFLNPHFVHSKEKNYEDLSISEFCAGYMTILENESEEKRIYRIAHLKELMYLSTRFNWKCVLDYHGACLLEIERGHLKWGDSFQLLQSTTLAGGFLTTNNHRGGSGGNQSQGGHQGNRSNEGIIFCKGYQRGTCQQPRDHQGQFYGESRLLKHICAKCWLKSKTQAAHPETSADCPLKD